MPHSILVLIFFSSNQWPCVVCLSSASDDNWGLVWFMSGIKAYQFSSGYRCGCTCPARHHTRREQPQPTRWTVGIPCEYFLTRVFRVPTMHHKTRVCVCTRVLFFHEYNHQRWMFPQRVLKSSCPQYRDTTTTSARSQIRVGLNGWQDGRGC